MQWTFGDNYNNVYELDLPYQQTQRTTKSLKLKDTYTQSKKKYLFILILDISPCDSIGLDGLKSWDDFV